MIFHAEVPIDHAATGTQWAVADDVLLACDLDGNCVVDSGRELFGDQILIDAQDAAFGELRVWRDLNQDGQTQAGELSTLSDAGFSSITLGTGGATGSLQINGQTHVAADVRLASDPLWREFKEVVPLTQQAQALPEMLRSGLVRDVGSTDDFDYQMAVVLAVVNTRACHLCEASDPELTSVADSAHWIVQGSANADIFLERAHG